MTFGGFDVDEQDEWLTSKRDSFTRIHCVFSTSALHNVDEPIRIDMSPRFLDDGIQDGAGMSSTPTFVRHELLFAILGHLVCEPGGLPVTAPPCPPLDQEYCSVKAPPHGVPTKIQLLSTTGGAGRVWFCELVDIALRRSLVFDQIVQTDCDGFKTNILLT